MFSRRVPSDRSPNRLTLTLEQMRAVGRPILDLTESNPTRAKFEYPADLLAPLAEERGLRYAPEPRGLLEARRTVSADYARRGVDVSPERIILTASTSEAYSILFKILCDPGDAVLVPRPSYPLFEHLMRLDAVTSSPYDLDYAGSWSIDFASVERAWSDRTRAVLLVNPNNPTGSFVKADELDRLATLCLARGSAIVVDEVFADYDLKAAEADSRARPLDRRDVLTFSLGGLSKLIGLPQAKLGWIAVAGPDRLADEALSRLELVCDTYLSVATPVQLALSELLVRGATVRDQIQRRVSTNCHRLAALVEAAPACRVLTVEGGWYAVLHVPSIGTEEDLVLDLLTNDGVLVHPGYFFDFAKESYLIVSLLTAESVFAEGIQRIVRRFDCSQEPA